MKRRSFFHTTLAAAATAAAKPNLTAEPAEAKAAAGLIDVNVNLSRWPFRSLRHDDPAAMAAHLRESGVTQAWCGSFDSLLHKDLGSVNRRLAGDCAAHGTGLMLPVGAINPTLPDWQHDLGICSKEHGMKAIRLHPNYHGYKLDDPVFLELPAEAAKQKLVVQIVAQMEDQRTQHPLVQVVPVDLKPLRDALSKSPEAKVMVLNANRVMSMTALQGLPVWIDIAMLEGVGGVENLIKEWPADKVVFGSHAPFFYWEAARLKLQESELTDEQLAALTHRNASAALV